MAITTNIYTAANTTTVRADLVTALQDTGLFDEVTYSSTTVTCTKNSVDVLKINLGAIDGQALFTVKNSSDETVVSVNLNGNLNSYASITTIGSIVYVVATNSSTGVGCKVTTFCIGATNKGNIGVYNFYRREVSGGTTNTYRTMSTESLTDSNVGVSAPLSTSMTNICTYPATVQLRDGNNDIISHVYGVRYSMPLHTFDSTQIGVTPVTLKLGNKTYITDGLIMIEDA